MSRSLWLLVTLSACGGGDDGPPAKVAPPAVAIDAVPADAAAPFVDDLDVPAPVEHPPMRERRYLQIQLDSTPRGAVALVDGVIVGNTPAFWEGEVNGCVREFRFQLPGYVTAIYRFVPVRDGFVHGRLDRILEDRDGGMPMVVEPEPMPPCPTIAAPPRPRPRPRPASPPPDAAPAPTPLDAGPTPAVDAAAQ